MFKDTLLLLNSFPEATPDFAIARAAGMANAMGASVTALIQVLARAKVTSRRSFGEWLFDVPELIDESVARSATNARALSARFIAIARDQRVFQECRTVDVSIFLDPDRLMHHARLHDLTFLPAGGPGGPDELFVESVIFGSGRPLILIPANQPAITPPRLDRIVVAWDFSRAATRAFVDALPLLRVAKEVRVVTVTGEKPLDSYVTRVDFERHVLMHRADAVFDQVDAAGRPIAAVLSDHAVGHGADLLVMGAFEHNRVREFVLGGATRGILNRPPLPVLLSH